MLSGLRAWFFPNADDRVARARKRMEAGRWADARLEVLELDHPDAPAIRRRCEEELARMNLDAAISWCRAGDEARVQHHLEAAEGFRAPGMDDLFREARRTMRAIREERAAEARRAAREEEERLLGAGPAAVGAASWREATPVPAIEGDDEAAARIALAVENYAPELRATVAELGAPFARALLDLEDGRPDLALQGFLGLPDDHPVVRYERARTAYALGDPQAAARELRAFARLHGHHAPMGRHHTGSFLAQCLLEAGEPAEALRVMRHVRADAPREGGALFARLLEIAGEREEAEAVLVELIREHPKETGLYRMLAELHVAAGRPERAMAVLERSLQAMTCTPGTCGYRPPDLAVIRMLATLYLEHGRDRDRGLELAQQAAALVRHPTWEDAYLHVLALDRAGHPDAPAAREALWEQTPSGDPRSARLEAHLPRG